MASGRGAFCTIFLLLLVSVEVSVDEAKWSGSKRRNVGESLFYFFSRPPLVGGTIFFFFRDRKLSTQEMAVLPNTHLALQATR
jgi:hypothetical protein